MKITRENIGDSFQALTKYDRDEPPRGRMMPGERPDQYKAYESPMASIGLPEPETAGGGPLWELIASRRTRRTYRPEPLTLAHLSQLLWAAGGVTKQGKGATLRAVPSAGALYPIELYVMANAVDGLEPGIYHYEVREHRLALIKEGPFGEEAAAAALGQSMLAKSGAVILMTAVVERTRFKYAQRAYRYIYLDAGHVGQDICLAAESLGLGCCPIGAFYDGELNLLLGVDGVEETVLYAMTIGR